MTTGAGRRLYERARALQKAKRAMLARHPPPEPVGDAKVLQFPTTEEVTDG